MDFKRWNRITGWAVFAATAKNKSSKIEILFNNENQFDGIINFIRNQDIDGTQNSIEITASSVANPLFPPSNVIEYETDQLYFYTKNSQNSWIRFDFKENRVSPTSYTLRTDMSSDYHPKSWVIEGKNEEGSDKWEAIDERNNEEKMKGNGITHTFPIQNSKEKAFRYIRMRSTGIDWDNSNYLAFNAIEFYSHFLNKNS